MLLAPKLRRLDPECIPKKSASHLISLWVVGSKADSHDLAIIARIRHAPIAETADLVIFETVEGGGNGGEVEILDGEN